ncbi:MAG: hypothetical protein FJX71_01475 [Alphaproteobacteria bacterium]|nr:hypothetical protein [Alphaproteobacteria bacterium]
MSFGRYFTRVLVGCIFWSYLTPGGMLSTWGQEHNQKLAKSVKNSSQKKRPKHKKLKTTKAKKGYGAPIIFGGQTRIETKYSFLPFFLIPKPHDNFYIGFISTPIALESLSKIAQAKDSNLPDVKILIEPNKGEPNLIFDWQNNNSALAVLKEGSKWWIVFDEKANPLLPSFEEHSALGFKNIEVLPTQEGLVLQVTVEDQLTPEVAYKDNKWRIIFKPQPQLLFHQASIEFPQSQVHRLIIEASSLGKEIHFIDQRTGYGWVVFPSYRVGWGIESRQEFPDFKIMEAPQGVGIQTIKDDLMVKVIPGGIEITHPDGLAISRREDREQVRTWAMPTGFFAQAQDLDWENRKEEINQELLDLPHDQHGPGELELAWLLLSQGEANEALGYLTHLAKMRPSIADLSVFKALQGVANLLLHRYYGAEQSLREVREEPEVQIWLSILKAIQYPSCLGLHCKPQNHLRSHFQMAKPLLQSYPKPLRNQLMSLILMAAIAANDIETLTSFLEGETSPQERSAKETFNLARAKMLLNQGKEDEGLQILGELMERALSSKVRAIARFDYIAHRLETNMISKEDAFLQLRNLRSRWRGGWFDQQISEYLVEKDEQKG